MKFNLRKSHWVGIITSLIIILIAFFLMQFTVLVDIKLFSFILGISLVILGLPFFISLVMESKQSENKESMFLEFSRDLVEGVRSGTSISKSILNVRNKDYGSLSIHVDKLANQISMGIPVRIALSNFGRDTRSTVIHRAITLIQEAERAGGGIEEVLASVSESISQIEKLKKERKAAIYTLAVQGYIVFLIFIIIMLVMQFQILPITNQIGLSGSVEGTNFLSGTGANGINFKGAGLDEASLGRSFLYLLVVQGFFAGLVIGKISEGTIKAGLKHSFILVALSLLISTGANLFLG